MDKTTKYYVVRFSRMLWLICLVFMFIGSTMPETPQIQQFLASDKLLHLISYAGLAFLQPLFLKTERLCFRCAFALILWGILLEGVQGLTPTRSPSVGDIVANTAGVILGTWAGMRIRKRLYRTESA